MNFVKESTVNTDDGSGAVLFPHRVQRLNQTRFISCSRDFDGPGQEVEDNIPYPNSDVLKLKNGRAIGSYEGGSHERAIVIAGAISKTIG